MDQSASLKKPTLHQWGGAPEELIETARRMSADLLRDHPADPRFLYLRGIVDFQQGQTKEAEECMEKALVLAPQSEKIAYAYGLMLIVQNKFAAALSLMQRVVALNPCHAEAYHHVGIALKKAGDILGALAAFDKSLELKSRNAEVWNEKGNILKEMDRLADAAACYEQALAVTPDYQRAINNLGVIRYLQNDLDGAEALYQKALTVGPRSPEALSNLGSVRRLKGDFGGAILYLEEALALRPGYPEALNNLGNTLKDAGRLEEAVAVYRKALRFMPDNGELHTNLSIPLLALGRFAEGWREQEWRWKTRQFRRGFRAFAQPMWRGEAGDGRTLLIHAEQGLGDTLQFCRYAPLAKGRGFHVVIEAPPSLMRLIQSLDGVDRVVIKGDALPPFDLHCPMMSLPFVFQTTVETIPAKLPYLSPNQADVTLWRDRVEPLADGKLKVGLVWAGRSRTCSVDHIAADQKRSITPDLLAPLLDVPGVRFFCLQKDGARAPDTFGLIDWMADCHDLADTAALIMNLDLVISVDTAAAHLAGALGKPIWLLNRFNGCWRWLDGRDDSPWYPGTLRQFRQQEMGAWPEVVRRVRTALSETSSHAADCSEPSRFPRLSAPSSAVDAAPWGRRV